MSETGDQNQDGTSESVDSSTSLPVCTQPSPTFLPQPIAQINIPHHGTCGILNFLRLLHINNTK